MHTSTITSKGQTTIPIYIRKALNLSAGDTIEYCLHNDGTITIVPETVDVLELAGMMPKPKNKVSIEEMKMVIKESVAKKRMGNQ
jgi:AbrB family looped-hinge helix DNA binding protein